MFRLGSRLKYANMAVIYHQQALLPVLDLPVFPLLMALNPDAPELNVTAGLPSKI